jgi:hypothetical protein
MPEYRNLQETEILVPNYTITRRHVSEDRDLQEMDRPTFGWELMEQVLQASTMQLVKQ